MAANSSPPQPAYQVALAHRPAQGVGDATQHGIADVVAVGVVDALEVVDIDQQQMRGAGPAPEMSVQRRIQAAAVEQLRQRVARRRGTQRIAHAPQHQPHDQRRQNRRQRTHVDVEDHLELAVHAQRLQPAAEQLGELHGVEHADAADQADEQHHLAAQIPREAAHATEQHQHHAGEQHRAGGREQGIAPHRPPERLRQPLQGDVAQRHGQQWPQQRRRTPEEAQPTHAIRHRRAQREHVVGHAHPAPALRTFQQLQHIRPAQHEVAQREHFHPHPVAFQAPADEQEHHGKAQQVDAEHADQEG